MLFNSHEFLFLFAPVFFLAYFGAHGLNSRNALLLLASYGFYGWHRPSYCLLLLASTTVACAAGWLLAKTNSGGRRQATLALAIVALLGLLFFFKYYHFLRGLLPLSAAAWLPDVNPELPVGISFYTFMGVSYVLDVYWKRTQPAQTPARFMLFMSMFPHLVAGPIIHYQTLAEELAAREHTIANGTRGIQLFVVGLAKKVLLADTMALIGDAYFGTPIQGALPAWTAMVAYSFQIYFDFSGYSDMAMGIGLVLGFHFPQNFDAPYSATSPTDFWRRWHITLSTWIRDYMFLPWGRAFKGTAGRLAVLFVCMTLCGLWHGASWMFVIWGAYHGLLLVGQRVGEAILGPKRSARIPQLPAVAMTFALVTLGWVFFRSQSLAQAQQVFENLFFLHGLGSVATFIQPTLLLMLAICALIVWGRTANSWQQDFAPRWWRVSYVLGLFVVSVLGVFVTRETPFLYFQF